MLTVLEFTEVEIKPSVSISRGRLRQGQVRLFQHTILPENRLVRSELAAKAKRSRSAVMETWKDTSAVGV